MAVLERQIWGYSDSEDVVPPPVLIISVRRGGILLGGFDDAGAMKGFVYSMPAVKDGRLTQWSHMLGVVADARDTGLGSRLKLAQRDAALRLGVDLIEWTFDPLQALNAHFNFVKLGVVAEEYRGQRLRQLWQSPACRRTDGSPDRGVADQESACRTPARLLGRPSVRDQSISSAAVVNPSGQSVTAGVSPGRAELALDERRVLLEIPVGFTEMLDA